MLRSPASRSSHLALAAVLAIVVLTTACSDDGATTIDTSTGTSATVVSATTTTTTGSGTIVASGPVPLRCAPPLTGALDGNDGRPLVCAAARFLSKEEEADPSGDYVLFTMSWALPDEGKLSVTASSSAPTLDGVFVTGSLAGGDEVVQSAAQPNAGNNAVFVSTSAAGRCMVRQKVAQGTGDVDLALDITAPDGFHTTTTVHASATK